MLAPALLEKKLKGELAVLQKANKSCFNCSALIGILFGAPDGRRSLGHYAKGFGTSTFTRDDVNKLQAYGNEVSAGIWLAKKPASVSRPATGDTNACQKWVQRVFRDSEFYDEAAAASAERTADARCGRTDTGVDAVPLRCVSFVSMTLNQVFKMIFNKVAKVELDTSGAPRLARPPPPGTSLRSPAGSQNLTGQRTLSAMSSGALRTQPSEVAAEASGPEAGSPLAAAAATTPAAAGTPSPGAPKKTKKTPVKDKDATAPAAAEAELEDTPQKAPKKKKAAAKDAAAVVQAEASEASTSEVPPKATKAKKAAAKAAESPDTAAQDPPPTPEEATSVAAPKKVKKKKKVVAEEDSTATVEAAPSTSEPAPASSAAASPRAPTPAADTDAATDQTAKKVKVTKKTKKVKSSKGAEAETPEAAAAADDSDAKAPEAEQKVEESPAPQPEASEASVAQSQQAAQPSPVEDLLGGMLPARQAFDPFPTAPGPTSATGAVAPAPHAAVVDPFAPKPDPVRTAPAPAPVSTVAAARTGDNDGVPTPSAAYGAVNSLQPFNPFEQTPQAAASVPGLGPYGPTPIAPAAGVILPHHNQPVHFGSQQHTSGAFPQQFPVPQNGVQSGAASEPGAYGMYAQAHAPDQVSHSYDAAPATSAGPPPFPNFAANAHSSVPQLQSTYSLHTGSNPQSMPGAPSVDNSGAPFQGSMQPPQPTAGVMHSSNTTGGEAGYPAQSGAAAEAPEASAAGGAAMHEPQHQAQPFASAAAGTGALPQSAAPVAAPAADVIASSETPPQLQQQAPQQQTPQPAQDTASREPSSGSVPPAAASRTGSRPGSPTASAAKRSPLSANLFAAPQVAAQMSAPQSMQYGSFGMPPTGQGWPGQAHPQAMHAGISAYGGFAGQNTGYHAPYYAGAPQMYPGAMQQQYGAAPTGNYSNWTPQMMQGQGGYPGAPQGMGMQWPQGAQPGGPAQAGQLPMGQHQMGQQQMGQMGQHQMGQMGQHQFGQPGAVGQSQMQQPGALPGAPMGGMMMQPSAGSNAPAGGNPFGQPGGAADPNLSNAFAGMGM